MAHVLDHSNHHQVYTDFRFIGKCNYIKLPPQYLWDNTSLQNNSLLFLALQSLADGKPLPQLLSVSSVLRLMYPIPYTCKSLFILGCLCCFHVVFRASEGSQDTYFLWGGVVSLTPNPQPGGPGYPFSLGHHLDLSGMGGPTSSYATASITLRITWPHKPHHYVKVGIPSVGGD